MSREVVLDKIKCLHQQILERKMSIPDFLTTIHSLDYSDPNCYLAAVSAIMSALIYQEDFSDKVAKILARCISKALQSSCEIVRRSCLQLLLLYSQDSTFLDLLSCLADQFPMLGIRGQEMMLSFAFSFHRNIARHFEVFVKHAKRVQSSSDELLAAVAEDFLLFIQDIAGENESSEGEDEPRIVMRFRASVDLSKSLTKQSEPKHESDLDDIPEENIEPEKETSEEEDLKIGAYDVDFLNEDRDWENAEPPMGGSKLRSSIVPKNGTFKPQPLDEEPKARTEPPRTAAWGGRKTRDTTNFGEGKDSSKNDIVFKTVSSPHRQILKPKTATGRGRTTLPEEKAATRAAASKGPNIGELVADMRNKDWEKQQRAVDSLTDIIARDPSQLSVSCKEIWMNLVDLFTAGRTQLANNSLKLGRSLYEQFSQQLSNQSGPQVATLLNVCCSMHNFLAEEASKLLAAIADLNPTLRTFNNFLVGARHKNPVARAQSIDCISIMLNMLTLEDKEFVMIIKAAVPMIRDTKMECREQARKLLKILSDDPKFWPTAERVVHNTQELSDLRRVLE